MAKTKGFEENPERNRKSDQEYVEGRGKVYQIPKSIIALEKHGLEGDGLLRLQTGLLDDVIRGLVDRQVASTANAIVRGIHKTKELQMKYPAKPNTALFNIKQQLTNGEDNGEKQDAVEEE